MYPIPILSPFLFIPSLYASFFKFTGFLIYLYFLYFSLKNPPHTLHSSWRFVVCLSFVSILEKFLAEVDNGFCALILLKHLLTVSASAKVLCRSSSVSFRVRMDRFCRTTDCVGPLALRRYDGSSCCL